MTRWVRILVALCAAAMTSIGFVVSTEATPSATLTRSPYLTDLVAAHVTVNWATTTAVAGSHVTYGRVGKEPCRAHRVNATSTPISVGAVSEFQWKAQLTALAKNTSYCYRVFGDSTDLLGPGPAQTFRSQIPARSSAAFSFAVLGDWGYVGSTGENLDQENLVSQIASSGARFAVTTGDTAYPDGSQLNYGDLQQTGANTSTVFGPSMWTVAGGSIPLFNAQGNHGLRADALTNWPQDKAVASSSGRYRMETFCCLNGTSSASYPSGWYAFNAGPARFYVLDAAWDNANVGTSSMYGNDHDYHWDVDSAEYQWLQHDLETHPKTLSFAFFHFPLYTDNATERSDPWLQGDDNLEGLLAQHGVDVVFNGHAHIYERNAPSASGMPVSYVTGGGGARVEPVSACTPIDQYAIGWDYSASTHGSRCGAAALPTTIDQVYHFLLVTVDGAQVTVTPTDELGRAFDSKTYDFSG
ncbi:MAG: metallophosphoesterase family protein [Actinomycetota bacterium]